MSDTLVSSTFYEESEISILGEMSRCKWSPAASGPAGPTTAPQLSSPAGPCKVAADGPPKEIFTISFPVSASSTS